MADDSTKQVSVGSRSKWNDSGFEVTKDLEYEVTITGTWEDNGNSCGPEGWSGTFFMNQFWWLRRARRFPWGALIGSVDQKKPFFHIMPGRFRAPASGRLFCFFNDARGFYGNNDGKLELAITRVPPGTEQPKSKSIVLFSDGTGNSSAKLFKTNVWRMYEAVDLGPPSHNKRPQISYYDDGVGTSRFRPMAILGGAFGSGLKRNVLDIYRFACRNYRDGDDIYAFGFSRGAFTIRLVIELIASQGLVRSDNEAELRRRSARAYCAFRDSMLPRWLKFPTRLYRGLRDLIRFLTGGKRNDPNANIHPPIRFVGVWDTVAAYGGPIIEITRGIDNWIYALSMPNRRLNERVSCARHALALDDQRDSFHPVLWDEVHEAALVKAGTVGPDRLKQVWFTGMHADVGGGYPDESLSYVSLLWMMKEAEQAGLRTLRVIKARFVALASSYGPIHNSRAGVAAYYRYQPRRIGAWLEPPEPHTRMLRDPAVKNAAGKPCGLLLQADVHESVINRIVVGTDRYAPLALPPVFRIVPELGIETAAQADSSPHDPPKTRANEPLVSREIRERLATSSAARAAATERVWDFIWWRRITYFATLAATLLLIGLPWFVHRLWFPPLLSDGRTGIGKPIRLLQSLLPDFASSWVNAYADNPFYFLLFAMLIGAFIWTGNRLERKLRGEARLAWTRSIDGLPLPRRPVSLTQKFRNAGLYQAVVTHLKWSFLPNVVGPVILVFLLWLGLSIVAQVGLLIRENGTMLCGQGGPPMMSSQRDFRTREVCSGSFGSVAKGTRYSVSFEVVEPWYDSEVAASPRGLGLGDLPSGAGYLGAPWRRAMHARFLQPVLQIRPTDGNRFTRNAVVMYPLDLKPVAGMDSVYRGEFEAQRTGELFMFANDAMFPLRPSWWRLDYLYFYEKSGFGPPVTRGNRGTACVTIMPTNVKATTIVHALDGSVCAQAAKLRHVQ